MPNWVKNKVRAVNKEDTAKLIAMLVKDGPRGKMTNFNGIIPMPEELMNTKHGYYPGCEEICERNKAKYGYASWYDFACHNWGTERDGNETIPIIVAYADEDIGNNYGIKEYHENGESDIEIAGEDIAIANAIWGFEYDPDDEYSDEEDFDKDVHKEVNEIIYR